jgi:hypothetical protein
MIDNIELILPLLIFESDDDFYYLQILQRKKENAELGSSSRVIKNYYITSKEYLLKKYDEIKKLCEFFNARASIRLNKRSFEKVGFKMLENIANSMRNREYKFLNKSYDRACGKEHNDKHKKWILDIDESDWLDSQTDELVEFLHNLQPVGNKYITEIPSKSGLHIITSPFNKEEFNRKYKGIEIHCNNPTSLFIPIKNE